jgi:hypothetical protein
MASWVLAATPGGDVERRIEDKLAPTKVADNYVLLSIKRALRAGSCGAGQRPAKSPFSLYNSYKIAFGAHSKTYPARRRCSQRCASALIEVNQAAAETTKTREQMERKMGDLLYLGIGFGAFALLALYVWACGRA